MQVTTKDGSILNYCDAQWLEYRDGAVLLMKTDSGRPASIVAALSIASVHHVDASPPQIIAYAGDDGVAEHA
jgi:hypothetical protein